MSTLSFSKGKRIAKIVGGADDGKIIYLYDSSWRCCLNCGDKCSKKRCCPKCSMIEYHTQYSPENLKIMIEQIKNGKGNNITFEEEEEGGGSEPLKHIELRGGSFQQIPSNQPRVDPDLIYVSGRRGSGKSYWIAQYLQQFKEYYPRYRIYLFSAKEEDKLLDQFITKRIDVNEVRDAQFTSKDFETSLVIFDDVDSLPTEKNNNIKADVYKVMTDIIETGRSLGVFCIVTSHLAANSGESKRILNGCSSYTFFLSSSSHQTEYSLNNYFGFTKKQIKKIQNMKGARSVTIIRTCPQLIMTNTEIMFQNELNVSK